MKSMTKSLIINCSLDPKSSVPELRRAIEEFSQYTVVGFRDVSSDFRVANDVDTVIVSGSFARIVKLDDREMFKEIVRLISIVDRPLLGICFGHQLISWSLGAEADSLATPVEKFEEISPLRDDEIFDGFEENQSIPLAERHNDYITEKSLQKAGLILLANSSSCQVEAVKHQKKTFYGVQFHPERTQIKDEIHLEGLKIIENFYKRIVKS